MSGVNADYRPPSPESWWTRYDDDPDFMTVRDGTDYLVKLSDISPMRAKQLMIETWDRFTSEERVWIAQVVRARGEKSDGETPV